MNDPAFQQWWSRFERLGASPASVAALMRMYKEIDVRAILPTIQAPTLVIHRTGDRVICRGLGDLSQSIFRARVSSSFRATITYFSSAKTLTRLPMRSRSF